MSCLVAVEASNLLQVLWVFGFFHSMEGSVSRSWFPFSMFLLLIGSFDLGGSMLKEKEVIISGSLFLKFLESCDCRSFLHFILNLLLQSKQEVIEGIIITLVLNSESEVGELCNVLCD